MLKILLVVLVVINAALAALIGGYLDAWMPNGHEPQRLQQQISPEKIRLVGRAVAPVALVSSASPAPPNPMSTAPVIAPSAAASTVVSSIVNAPDAIACIELGDFSDAEANRLQTGLATLLPADRLARRRVSDPNSFVVYIPSLGDKAGADRKAGELRRLGISDFYVLQNGADLRGELRYGVSLGIFKTRTAAEDHLAELVKKGVRSARITGRGENSVKVAFQLRGLDDKSVAAAVKLAGTEQRDCAPL